MQSFTLIELLVIIALIGLLASIVLVNVNQVRTKSKIARALTDMKQIITAGEIVFNDYGYYPNDSEGVICPKDIVINAGNGEKFGVLINICNDPWDEPYVWSNKCDNGSLRKSDGTGVNCPAFSDKNYGPVGILSAGKDKIPEGCSGDDICYGFSGFPIYNWGLGGGGGTPSPPAVCADIVATCSGFNFLSDCNSRDGCTWSSDSCSGSYPSSCSGFTDQISCTAQSGCTWGGAGCSGTPNACTSYGGSPECVSAGCSWTAPTCSGTAAPCSTWNGTNRGTCQAQIGCTWNAGPKTCTGTHSACSTYDQTQCSSQANCSYISGGCSGMPTACSNYGDSPSCTTVGCSWLDAVCSGSYPSSCSGFTDQISCTTKSGCTWGGAGCSGSAVSCTTFSTQSSCEAEAGCVWQ